MMTTDFATTVGGDTLKLERRLPGPIDRVWAYLTDPKLFSTWFCDGHLSNAVGGDVNFEIGAHGKITIFDPPHVLEYTWNEPELSRGPLLDSIVRWELAEDGDMVRLTLTHSRLSEAEILPHSAGWHTFVERLGACLDGREPEPLEEAFSRFMEAYSNISAR